MLPCCVLLVSGCAGLDVAAAPLAGDPACDLAVRAAPRSVLDGARRDLDARGAAAWGDPAVVARCGLREPGPTTLRCLSVDGVDWLVDDRSDAVVFTTYGRAPALEVTVPADVGRDTAAGALVDLRPVAAALPRTSRSCLSADDA